MPTSNAFDPNTVRRRIQFFRAWTSSNADNVARRLDSGQLCAAIREIHESSDRYWTDSDETETTAWLQDPTHEDRFILATIKRKDLPLIEEDGVSERLELAVGKGIAEAIHVRLFPNNVVGAEYNDRGPRLPRLKYFLGSKRPETYRTMQIVPLLDEDTRGRLAGLRNVSLVEFAIARPTFEGVDDNRNYMQDLRNLFDVAEAGIIEISMRPKKQGEKLDTPAARAFVETMLDNQQTANALSKMAVRGFDPVVQASATVDLLGDRIVDNRRILRMNPTSRAVDAVDAFRAIGAAYNDVRSRIPKIALVDN